MWISEIRIKNFRPFYGEQTIKYSLDSTEKFTIIEAKSDTGKTSLLSAICWCFYGKDIGDVHEKGMHPFNLKRKVELEDGEADIIEVAITINNDGEMLPRYEIIRKARCMKSGDDMRYTFQGDSIIELTEWINNEAYPHNDPDYCNASINSILPEDIHLFFLFEGEKLESRFDFRTPSSIQAAIEKVSQIQQVNNAVDHLDVVRDKIYVQKEGKSESLIDGNNKHIDGLRQENERIQKNLTTYADEKEETERKIRDIDKILSNVTIPLIVKWSKDRTKLEEDNERINRQLRSAQIALTDTLLKHAPQAMCSKELNELLERILQSKQRNELPPKIGNVYIKELLNNGACICGRSLDSKSKEDGKAIVTLNGLLKREDLSEVAGILIHGRYLIEGLLKELPTTLIEWRDAKLKEIQDLQIRLTSNSAALKDINKNLIEYDEELIMKKNANRKELLQVKDSQTETIGRLRGSIKKNEVEIKKVRRMNDELAKKSSDFKKKKKVADFLDRAINKLSSIREELLGEVRGKVEQRTFECFSSLHWDTKNYYRLIIDDDYGLSLLDPDGNERIFTLSSGTKQVFLLSFISALSDVSGFKFPIFIDTPLANTDNDQRMNIAIKLPNYLSGNQVTLLMKDQEYSNEFRNTIQGSISKELKLIKTGGMTEVKSWA